MLAVLMLWALRVIRPLPPDAQPIVTPRALGVAACLAMGSVAVLVGVWVIWVMDASLDPPIEEVLNLVLNRDAWLVETILVNAACFAAVLIAARRCGLQRMDLGIKPPSIPNLHAVALGVAGLLLVLLMRNLTRMYAHFPAVDDLLAVTRKAMTLSTPVALARLASVLILSPISEELLFRGMLMNAYKVFVGRYAAIALQAVLFSMLHVSGGLVFAHLGFAIVCGALYELTGTVVVPIFVHAAGNLLAIFFGI